jgi:hypothetical protein
VSTSAPSKGKGKVLRVVHRDDEVSSDDDVPLQRRMRAPNSGRSVASGPPLVSTAPRLDSSAAGDAVTATRAAVEKEAADAA